MTIAELLNQCNVNDIVSVIMKIASVDEADRASVYETHVAFIEHLKSIAPVETGHVVLALNYMDEGKVVPDTSLFVKEDIATKFKPESKLKDIANESILTDEEVEALCNVVVEPESYAYEFVPWSEVLGYEVSVPNVEKYGAATLLAPVIYEMTFFGFTQDEQDIERGKMEEAIRETEKFRAMPPEEQAKHSRTADEVFAELGYIDERTKAEKETDDRLMRREILYSKLQKYSVLRDYCTPQSESKGVQ